MVESEPTHYLELRDAYELHREALLRFAVVLVGDRDEAEDLVQDSFVRSAGRLAAVASDDWGRYLRKVIVNAWRTRYRRRALERAWQRLWPSQESPVTDLDERDRVWRHVLRLPTRQRSCVVLRYYEDLTEEETAHLLGCSIGTVKSQTHRALSKLGAEMERE